MSRLQPVTELQAAAIARIAQDKCDDLEPCGCEQAKECEFCPCMARAFIAAIDEVMSK